MPSRIAFSTLAFPDATLAAAVSAGRRWGYSGVELRLIDGELIDPATPAERRAEVRRTLAAAGLPVRLLPAPGRSRDLTDAVDYSRRWTTAPRSRVRGRKPGNGTS